jgi:hypothetical protein
MKQTVTVEIVEAAAMRFLRDLAAVSLIRFVPEAASEDDLVTAKLNEIYAHEDSSLDPAVAAAQAETLSGDDW